MYFINLLKFNSRFRRISIYLHLNSIHERMCNSFNYKQMHISV